jgi:hypothetical protein
MGETPVAPVCTSAPAIHGAPFVARRLASSTPVQDPAGAVLTYVWKADGTRIAAATGRTWTVRNAFFGRRITVRVTARNNSGGCATPPSAPTAPVSHDPLATFGVALSGNSILYPRHADAVQSQRLAEVGELGARWVRVNLDWMNIQNRSPRTFDWTIPDRFAIKARNAGVNVLFTILSTPAWANGARGNLFPPSDPATIGPFCARAAVHYQRLHVKVAFEVWNEPNLAAFWPPAPDAAAYTRLLRACYDAIRTTGLGTMVISGGLAPVGGYDTGNGTSDVNQVRFLEQMFAAGAAHEFDALGYHPYSYPAPPTTTDAKGAWPQMAEVPGHNIRQVMEANHFVVPIWATEYGMPSAGPSGSGSTYNEDWQAQDVARAAALWRTYPWAGKFFYYSLVDDQDGGDASSFVPYFGLVRTDYSHKPAFDAYRAAIASP